MQPTSNASKSFKLESVLDDNGTIKFAKGSQIHFKGNRKIKRGKWDNSYPT